MFVEFCEEFEGVELFEEVLFEGVEFVGVELFVVLVVFIAAALLLFASVLSLIEALLIDSFLIFNTIAPVTVELSYFLLYWLETELLDPFVLAFCAPWAMFVTLAAATAWREVAATEHSLMVFLFAGQG